MDDILAMLNQIPTADEATSSRIVSYFDNLAKMAIYAVRQTRDHPEPSIRLQAAEVLEQLKELCDYPPKTDDIR